MRAQLRLALTASLLFACSPAPETLGSADEGPGPQVRFDVFHRPLPEIPLPNDFATRYDATSPTLRRLNASMSFDVAPTKWEHAIREDLDRLSGWGTLAPITVSFSEPLDLEVFYQRHRKDNLRFDDDAVYVIDVTEGSPDLCKAVPLDLGQGNYPQVLAETKIYEADPREGLQTVLFEEVEEDANQNGVLDPGEDTDMDGVLDHPNTRDGKVGGELLDFYERETNTLIMKPMIPMRSATTYAAVITKRVTGPDGNPARSPFATINDASQTLALAALPGCLGEYGLSIDDVAFTWTFTTQDLYHDYRMVRDGLYGQGELARVGSDFPAEVSVIRDGRVPAPGVDNLKIVPGNVSADLFIKLMSDFGSLSAAGIEQAKTELSFIDYSVIGEIDSPQFFPRYDKSGQLLPLYEQVWDLEKPPRREGVPFWLFVPKNRKGPAPVAIFIHGHGSTKFDGSAVAPTFARMGVATLAIDAPSHGVDLPVVQQNLARALFQPYGLGPFAEGILAGRALDWNGDGLLESGADYWVSYLPHTRDMVRQTMVDVMQVVRTLQSFDGSRRWKHDLNGDGTPELAGDFDADGTVDVGGDQPVQIMGGSLGGINSALAAGVEPRIESAVAVVPGGMLSEIGFRSSLSGVRNAMVLRALAPLYWSDGTTLELTVPDAEVEEVTRDVHDLPSQLGPADTVVLSNLTTGEHRCGAVQKDGRFRVSVPSDKGDRLSLSAYAGPLPPEDRTGCSLRGAAPPLFTVDTFDRDVTIGGSDWSRDSELVAVTDGFGARRGTPELRRLQGLAQVIVEQADPMNYAPGWEGHRPFVYGDGETVGANVIVMPSDGDPGVPAADGIALARAAGFVPFDHDDPRYGKSDNQVLIDTWAIEGQARMGHYFDSTGQAVLMDVEHLAALSGVDDGFDVPRLDPPLRLVSENQRGGFSGLMLPMMRPTGMHGFPSADPSAPFDLGTYLAYLIGHHLQTGGTAFSWDACQEKASCAWIPPPPN
jgi:hypothetical protein